MTREEAKREMMFAKRNVLAGSYIDQAYDVAIEALSQPERETGTYEESRYNEEWYCWYATCNECGAEWMGSRNFCPNCGAKMEKE